MTPPGRSRSTRRPLLAACRSQRRDLLADRGGLGQGFPRSANEQRRPNLVTAQAVSGGRVVRPGRGLGELTEGTAAGLGRRNQTRTRGLSAPLALPPRPGPRCGSGQLCDLVTRQNYYPLPLLASCIPSHYLDTKATVGAKMCPTRAYVYHTIRLCLGLKRGADRKRERR
jgi:hypothetical protein